MSAVLQEDIETVICSNLPWHTLANSTILITGSTGLIGSNLVRVLQHVSKSKLLNIRVIAYSRSQYGDIRLPIPIEENVDYIFHCAAMTSSASMVENPVETILTAVEGTKNVLEFANHKRCKGVVYLSSMEVYGQIEGEVSEEQLGYLDLSNPRSSYPASKRMCESLCVAYNKQYHMPVKIARLARTFGAGVVNKPDDNRVAMQFARNAMQGKDIVLHTTGNTIANCVYTGDAISALCTILLKGRCGEAYNISADNATVLRMATMLARRYNVNVLFDVPENIEKLGYAPRVGYTLNTNKLSELGWRPQYKLLDMYERMIAYWRGE